MNEMAQIPNESDALDFPSEPAPAPPIHSRFLFVDVAVSPNWLRIYAVAMPGVVAAVYLVTCLRRGSRQLLAALAVGTACLGLLQIWSRQHRTYVTTTLPTGVAAIPREGAGLCLGEGMAVG